MWKLSYLAEDKRFKYQYPRAGMIAERMITQRGTDRTVLEMQVSYRNGQINK